MTAKTRSTRGGELAGLAVDEEGVFGEEGGAAPVDELRLVFLTEDVRVRLPSQSFDLVRREEGIVPRGGVILHESKVWIGADPVEEVLLVLPGGRRHDVGVAFVVEKRWLDRLRPDVRHIRPRESRLVDDDPVVFPGASRIGVVERPEVDPASCFQPDHAVDLGRLLDGREEDLFELVISFEHKFIFWREVSDRLAVSRPGAEEGHGEEGLPPPPSAPKRLETTWQCPRSPLPRMEGRKGDCLSRLGHAASLPEG